ncbi:hypothetical protein RFI_06853, partial [Reticulomyxa filosa]
HQKDLEQTSTSLDIVCIFFLKKKKKKKKKKKGENENDVFVFDEMIVLAKMNIGMWAKKACENLKITDDISQEEAGRIETVFFVMQALPAMRRELVEDPKKIFSSEFEVMAQKIKSMQSGNTNTSDTDKAAEAKESKEDELQVIEMNGLPAPNPDDDQSDQHLSSRHKKNKRTLSFRGKKPGSPESEKEAERMESMMMLGEDMITPGGDIGKALDILAPKNPSRDEAEMASVLFQHDE